MSYVGWRKDNEAKYYDMVEADRVAEMPAFQEGSKNVLSTTVASTIVNGLLSDPEKITPCHFICIFAEYLYEQYNVAPIDLEILAQYVMGSAVNNCYQVAVNAAQNTAAALIPDLLSNPECREKLRELLDAASEDET